MPEPIIFVSNQRIEEGKRDEYIRYYREVAAFTEGNKPATFAHLAYLNESGTEASVAHIVPAVPAIEAHMRGIALRRAQHPSGGA